MISQLGLNTVQLRCSLVQPGELKAFKGLYVVKSLDESSVLRGFESFLEAFYTEQ